MRRIDDIRREQRIADWILQILGLVTLLLWLLGLSGCQAWTEGYQKAIYGETLQQGTPCKSSQRWDGHLCHPQAKGKS